MIGKKKLAVISIVGLFLFSALMFIPTDVSASQIEPWTQVTPTPANVTGGLYNTTTGLATSQWSCMTNSTIVECVTGLNHQSDLISNLTGNGPLSFSVLIANTLSPLRETSGVQCTSANQIEVCGGGVDSGLNTIENETYYKNFGWTLWNVGQNLTGAEDGCLLAFPVSSTAIDVYSFGGIGTNQVKYAYYYSGAAGTAGSWQNATSLPETTFAPSCAVANIQGQYYAFIIAGDTGNSWPGTPTSNIYYAVLTTNGVLDWHKSSVPSPVSGTQWWVQNTATFYYQNIPYVYVNFPGQNYLSYAQLGIDGIEGSWQKSDNFSLNSGTTVDLNSTATVVTTSPRTGYSNLIIAGGYQTNTNSVYNYEQVGTFDPSSGSQSSGNSGTTTFVGCVGKIGQTCTSVTTLIHDGTTTTLTGSSSATTTTTVVQKTSSTVTDGSTTSVINYATTTIVSGSTTTVVQKTTVEQSTGSGSTSTSTAASTSVISDPTVTVTRIVQSGTTTQISSGTSTIYSGGGCVINCPSGPGGTGGPGGVQQTTVEQSTGAAAFAVVGFMIMGMILGRYQHRKKSGR